MPVFAYLVAVCALVLIADWRIVFIAPLLLPLAWIGLRHLFGFLYKPLPRPPVCRQNVGGSRTENGSDES